jgi:hypothetical protein
MIYNKHANHSTKNGKSSKTLEKGFHLYWAVVIHDVRLKDYNTMKKEITYKPNSILGGDCLIR